MNKHQNRPLQAAVPAGDSPPKRPRRGEPNAGFFAVGVYHGKNDINIGTLLRSAHAFGAAFVFTVGQRYSKQASDVGKAWKSIPVMRFTDIDDLVNHLPFSCQLIGVELSEKATLLGQFRHPERAAYLLGAEDHGLSPDVMDRCHRLIEIEGATSCLNVATAGSIVMYDRARDVAFWGTP